MSDGRRGARSTVEITYSILVDGVEVGFGTSGESTTIDEAAHFINTAITRRDWETTSG